MSPNPPETAVETPAAAAPKAKKAKKPAAKKVKAKKAKPAPKKAEKPAKNGLRKPQIRVLKALAKKNGLTRAQIADKAPCDVALLTSWIGSTDPDTRAKNDKKMFPSLVTLGLVKQSLNDDESGTIIHSITAKGQTALKKEG